jgi:hypothetical protein
MFYIGQADSSFLTQYTEHTKALTQSLRESNFAETHLTQTTLIPTLKQVQSLLNMEFFIQYDMI